MSQSETAGDHRRITLPEHVLARVERRLPHTEFDTPDEYITYALEELLAQVDAVSAEEYDGAAEQEIESRLKSLGYLD